MKETFKEWSIIVNHNPIDYEPNKLMRLIYKLIWLNPRANKKLNHTWVVVKIGDYKYVADSQIIGFRVRMSLENWLHENYVHKRTYYEIPFETMIKYSKTPLFRRDVQFRFNDILGNKYDAQYWAYAVQRISEWLHIPLKWIGDKTIKSTNCFQSCAYIYDLPDWWKMDSDEWEKIISENLISPNQ